jgi:hypothetical protein
MPEETNTISEQFIEDMVDKVISRLSAKLDELDISLDYIGAILSGQATTDVGVRQKGLGRFATDRAPAPTRENE